MSIAVNPLTCVPPSEVPLQHAPLVRVIAQLRFPEILSVEQRDFVAPFQEKIRSQYPILRQDQALLLGAPTKKQTAWRFSDAENSWRVSLTPDFLALETTHYTNRDDFFGRLRTLTETLSLHIAPAQVDRLGVRYIDRVTGPAVDDIARLVRPEVLGISGTLAGAQVVHSISEAMFEVERARVLARWGCLPPLVTIDPSAIEASNERSWILDLDMSSADILPFEVEPIIAEARRYAERLYAVFRWAVTDDFLRHHGGQV